MNASAPAWVAAVSVLVRRGGRVLAMQRAADAEAAPGLWEAVSGRVEPGEEPLAAAEREVREETGLHVRLDPRPLTAYRAERLGQPMLVIVYRADWLAGEVRASREHDAWSGLTATEFAARSPLPQLVSAVHQALEG